MDAQPDLPAAPDERHISPAADDYRKPVRLMHVLWPALWLGVAAVALLLVRYTGWPVFHGH